MIKKTAMQEQIEELSNTITGTTATATKTKETLKRARTRIKTLEAAVASLEAKHAEAASRYLELGTKLSKLDTMVDLIQALEIKLSTLSDAQQETNQTNQSVSDTLVQHSQEIIAQSATLATTVETAQCAMDRCDIMRKELDKKPEPTVLQKILSWKFPSVPVVSIILFLLLMFGTCSFVAKQNKPVLDAVVVKTQQLDSVVQQQKQTIDSMKTTKVTQPRRSVLGFKQPTITEGTQTMEAINQPSTASAGVDAGSTR